jgi:hypothetical protein
MSFDPFSKVGLILEKRSQSPEVTAPRPKKHKVDSNYSAMYAAAKATAKPAVVTQTGLTIKPNARSILEQSTLDVRMPQHAAHARKLERAAEPKHVLAPTAPAPKPAPKAPTVAKGPSVLDTMPPKQYDMFCSTELFDTDRLLICIELADELGLHEDHVAQAVAYLKQSEHSQLNVYYDNKAISLFTTRISDPALMKTGA